MRALLTAAFMLATPASASCIGQNLLDTMPVVRRDAITAAAHAVPFPTGNFWTATKNGATLTLIGTYHLGDPRHDQTMAAIGPLIDAATTLLVEAGPKEEADLKDRMARDPSVLILTDTTLPESMPPEDWEMISDAMEKRGIPPFMTATFQPWYIAVMLGIQPCQMQDLAAANGLDKRIIDRATRSAIPIEALEPYDTVFRIFEDIPLESQIGMIRSSLALEDRANDYAVTLAESYFRGESRLIWELMRAETSTLPGYTEDQINAEMAVMEEALMASRNRGWIPVIEAAAARGPTLAAFGALHLPGNDGVLDLFARAGWTLTPLKVSP